MPAEYICDSCKLAFIAGWYHYHRSDDYWAATFLVCSDCGALHRLEHPVDFEKAPSRIQHYGEPLHNVATSEFGTLRLPDPSDSVNVDSHVAADLECRHCHKAGTLISKIEDGASCPECRSTLGEPISSWMT